MRDGRLLRLSVGVFVALGLIVASGSGERSAAAPPKPAPKAGPKPGTKAHAKPRPKVQPKPHAKPHPGTRPKIAPKHRHRHVVPRRAPRVVVRAGPRVVVRGTAGVIREVSPPATVVAAKDLPVVPAKDLTEAEAYKVIRVADDYTVTLSIEGKEAPVRLVGVDPPLVARTENEAGEVPKAGVEFVRNLLAGESVYLDYDADLAEKDAEGNLVAYLYRAPDKLPVNLEIIRQGYGLVADAYTFGQRDLFAAYEQKAQADGKGIWAQLERDRR